MPDAIYAKEGREAIIYSAIKIEGAVEYIKADIVAEELRKLLVTFEAKSEVVLDKMKDILG